MPTIASANFFIPSDNAKAPNKLQSQKKLQGQDLREKSVVTDEHTVNTSTAERL